jgi:adenine-specific DNA-methyltransferase
VNDLRSEKKRLLLQKRLDAEKDQAERNRLGQFATPTALARDIMQFGVELLGEGRPIRFLDPAIGTGSFFSALINTIGHRQIQRAKGYELDAHYGEPARTLWMNTELDLEIKDFTRVEAPTSDANRFNLLICNPPYVRHHHLSNGEKMRLQDATEVACAIRIAGLAGLYCYFLALSHAWMQKGGIAGWLIPSEFMDVNYGSAIKRYLLEKVTLVRIHRFDPNDVQFDDALVSSAVVWLRNDPPPANHAVEFTFGGSLLAPKLSRKISSSKLWKEHKWTRFPEAGVRKGTVKYHLSELFTIKRGIATGDNKFFILSPEQIRIHNIPSEVLRPILPGPRFLANDEIEADQNGLPKLDRQLFLLDCRLPQDEVRKAYPELWRYLQTGEERAASRYLCRSRKVWYLQEEREPAPILCTYLGRSNTKSGRPFRFILNNSQGIAANVYLLLYPKPVLARAIALDQSLLRRVWEALNRLSPSTLIGEGRVYGGGLRKLEPRELASVDATTIADLVPGLRYHPKPNQINFLDQAFT